MTKYRHKHIRLYRLNRSVTSTLTIKTKIYNRLAFNMVTEIQLSPVYAIGKNFIYLLISN